VMMIIRRGTRGNKEGQESRNDRSTPPPPNAETVRATAPPGCNSY
jgi:hypothetical protein